MRRLLRVASVWLAASHATPAADRIDFARDIQPLLSRHCTACHGGVKRAGSLVLLPGGGLPQAGDSGLLSVVPGKPDQSELYRRLTAADAEERMPAKSPPLGPDEIVKNRRWIEAGANWPRHWSLMPMRQVEIPSINSGAVAESEIDRFVLSRLEANGIRPSPQANRYALIRRLSLDPRLDAIASRCRRYCGRERS